MLSVVLSVKNDFIILFAGIIAGFASEIGAAGSIIALPMLISLGVPPIIANGTNRIANFSLYTSAYEYYVYKEKQIFVPRYIILLSLPIMLGAIIGSVVANLISDTVTQWLVIALSILFITFNTRTGIREDIIQTKEKISLKFLHFLALLGAGFYAGLIQSGMTYIIFYVLANVMLIDFKTAKYLKFYYSMFVTALSLVVFMFYGNINYRVGAVLLIGGAIGGWLGSVEMQKWNPRQNKNVIQLVIIFSLIYLILFMLRYGQKGILFI